jgi:exodeoxyribonuclease-3
MRIATWNVNGIRSRLDFLLKWLADRQPDVVGLQELKVDDHEFPHLEIEAAGYKALVHGQKAWNGVAVLSKQPATEIHRGLEGQEEMGSRMLCTRLGELSFTTIYWPNGKTLDHEDFPRKLAWGDALVRHFQEHHSPQERTILCGDFNVCPTPLDTYIPKAGNERIFHTDAERARFAALLDWGFVDAFREKHPDVRAYSWWDYRAGAFHRNQGMRIDFVLATTPLMSKVTDAWIDRNYRKKQDGLVSSDHTAVIVETP